MTSRQPDSPSLPASVPHQAHSSLGWPGPGVPARQSGPVTGHHGASELPSFPRKTCRHQEMGLSRRGGE